MRFFKNLLISLLIVTTSGCGASFEAQSKPNSIQGLNQKTEYTGNFNIKCYVELESEKDQISFSEESGVFNYKDLSTSKSQLVISLPPYNLVAKFVNRTEAILNINATYCVNFYTENDPNQAYCQKDSAELGELLKNGIINLPYSRQARLNQSITYQGVQFENFRSECVLLNAN